MQICILEADRPSEEFLPDHGTYAGMFERWLGAALPEAAFTHLYVAGGAPLPEPGAFDGYLVTGARAGVHDGHGWIAALKGFLQDLRAAERPVAGVCFGHQIMAEAYGGKVERAGTGWVVGRHGHALTGAGRPRFGGRAEIAALSFHQDQVTEPPPGAELLLSQPLSPHGGFAYPFRALSVQFHPELSPDYIRDLLLHDPDLPLPPATASEALASLDGALDAGLVAGAFADFYREARP